MKAQDRDALIRALHERFEMNVNRHKGIAWPDVLERISNNPAALSSLRAMEATGGEPDAIG